MNSLIERRVHRRFKVTNNIHALALSQSGYAICQIEDVSMGGMAMSCEICGNESISPEEISILFQGDFWGLSGLPVQVIWEKTVNSRDASPTKKFGIRFRQLNEHKKTQLSYFIRHFSKMEH